MAKTKVHQASASSQFKLITKFCPLKKTLNYNEKVLNQFSIKYIQLRICGQTSAEVGAKQMFPKDFAELLKQTRLATYIQIILQSYSLLMCSFDYVLYNTRFFPFL